MPDLSNDASPRSAKFTLDGLIWRKSDRDTLARYADVGVDANSDVGTRTSRRPDRLSSAWLRVIVWPPCTGSLTFSPRCAKSSVWEHRTVEKSRLFSARRAPRCSTTTTSADNSGPGGPAHGTILLGSTSRKEATRMLRSASLAALQVR